MVEIDDTFADRPEGLEDTSDRNSSPFDFTEDRGRFATAFALVLFLAPIGLMVGVMRWNIADTLDADLEWILTRFCDTVLLLCIALPICPLLPGEWGNQLSHRVFKGLWRLLWIAKWIGILAFTAAAVASLGYVFWMVWKLIAG